MASTLKNLIHESFFINNPPLLFFDQRFQFMELLYHVKWSTFRVFPLLVTGIRSPLQKYLRSVAHVPEACASLGKGGRTTITRHLLVAAIS
ncbi:hypothetical protein CEXT_486621 [Caerostris extrusa]|uniref:Uncharacterized protein n=1 Tax=Caerostris extrusa TaxID=172846 RepID=A0AAV4P046_CAEEX|nr:hypothetical protein CEXT_486621 [Caerostris extrusa]